MHVLGRCPHCDADLRVAGAREYGAVRFSSIMRWDATTGWYEVDEPEYGDCTYLEWACRACGEDIGFDPNDPEEEHDED